jgi:hypothetical protein
MDNHIQHSKNIVTGHIDAAGNVIVGDNIVINLKGVAQYPIEKAIENLSTKLDKTLEEINHTRLEYFLQNIIFTADGSSAQEKLGRIDRLTNVAKYVYDNYGKLDILGLHDHKGELTVMWNNQPTNQEKKYLEIAWEQQNESGENVVHDMKEYDSI